MARARRLWLWIPLGILLLIAVAVLAVLSAPVQTAIAHRILNSVNNSIHGELSVGSVHVTPFGVIVLRDAKLKDPGGGEVLTFQELRGRVDLWGIRSRRLRIYNLKIDTLRFDMALDSAGTSNLERALSLRDTTKAPPDTSKPAQWIIQLDKLKIDGGPTYIHNPVDTLIAADEWTLVADMTFKERKLDYNLEYDSPWQVHVKTGGSLVLADTIRDVRGRLELQVDSTYSGGLYIPANTFGRTSVVMEYTQRADSMDLNCTAQSSVLGNLLVVATMVYPPGVVAGHGDITFENLRPAALWHDTTDLMLNGRIAFVKDSAVSVVNGWNLRMTFGDTRYGEYALRDADLRIVTRDSTATISGSVNTGHGVLEIKAFADSFIPEQMDVRADLSLQQLNLHKLISQIPDSLSPLSGTIHLNARAVAAKQRTIQADAHFTEFTYGQYHVTELFLTGGIAGNHFAVDTLAVAGYGIALNASAAGELNGDVTYSIKMDAPSLQDLEPLLAAMVDSLDTLRGTVSLDLNGVANLRGKKFSSLTAEGDVLLTNASYGTYYVRTADARLVQFEYPSLMFNGALSIDSLVAATQRVDSADVTANGDLKQFRMALNLWARADTIQLGAEFTARLYGDVKEVALDTLHARTFGVEWWSEFPSTIRLENGRIEVDALTFRSEIGVLRASGYMQRHGEQDMTIELSALKTGAVGEILKRPLPESTMNIRVQFAGTDQDLNGDLFITADSILYERKLVADELTLQVSANRTVTTLDGTIIMHGDTAGFFGGEFPMQISLDSGVVLLKDSPMSGRAKIIEQRLEAFTQFLPSGTKIGGIIAGDATFKGTPANPQWLGTFVIRDGRYRDARSGVDYKDIAIQGEMIDDSLRISRFDVRSVGKMTGQGTAVMAFPLPKDVNLHLNLSRFQVMDSPQMRIRTSGHLDVHGPLTALDARGELEFDEVIYHLTSAAQKNVEEINLDSVLTVMRGDSAAAGPNPFSPYAIYRSMANELHLFIPGNCWVRGSGMNIELTGDLWMYKDYGMDPTINGSIQTRQGDVSLFGKRFEVVDGKITFEGPINNPTLDVTAEYKPPSTTTASTPLRVHVFGTMTETRFEFQGMTNEEAIQALLGGSGGGGLLSQAELQKTASGAAAGQLSSLVGQWAGLDVLEYRPSTGPGNNLTSGSLEVGSYVTERLFVRVTQPIETGQIGQTVTIEYRLLDWLKLRAQQEARQASAFDLLFQLDWR